MKNFINLNGQVIEFTEEQIKKMMESVAKYCLKYHTER